MFLLQKSEIYILTEQFENALDLIDSVKIPKKLILEEDWRKFSEDTLNLLS
jgi:hypothetical protein